MRNGQILYLLVSVKCTASHCCYAFRDRDPLCGMIIKGTIPDFPQAVRQRDGSQRSAVVKRTLSYFCNPSRDYDCCQILISIKRIFRDLRQMI